MQTHLVRQNVLQNAAFPTNILRKPKLHTRLMHSQYHTRIGTRCETLKNSFMHRTLKDWNPLPHRIINKTEASENPAKTFASIVKGEGYILILSDSLIHTCATKYCQRMYRPPPIRVWHQNKTLNNVSYSYSMVSLKSKCLKKY